MTNEYHVPVLVEEVFRYLRPVPVGIYVDGTLGGGGHTEYLLTKMSPQSRMICFDADSDALRHAQNRLSKFADRITFMQGNFAGLAAQLRTMNVSAVQGLLLDLGVSSHQIDEGGRGFSFQENSRIDMRMNNRQTLDGWTVVNMYDPERLTQILWEFGEEKNSRRIAKRIVESRERRPIDTTNQLAEIVELVCGKKFLMKSLARVFQAIRIEVNGELDNLQKVLEDAVDLVAIGGRIVVISYHSLEDRIVKRFFRAESELFIRSRSKLLPDQPRHPRLSVLTKRPVEATPEEVNRNQRARSAKLRAAERM